MRHSVRFDQRGQALVEFALVIPLLVLIVFGTFDLGYAVFTNNMLNNAAREGARAGTIIGNDNAKICDRVKTTAPSLNFVCPGDLGTRITIDPPGSRVYEEPITVTVRYNYQPLTPVVGSLSPGGFPLSSTSVMIVEGVYEFTP